MKRLPAPPRDIKSGRSARGATDDGGIFIYCYCFAQTDEKSGFSAIPGPPLARASAGLIELRDAYASFRIARGKLSRKLAVSMVTRRILVETVNVDSSRCNVNAFTRKLPATVEPDIYCYARGSFSRTAPTLRPLVLADK